MTAFRQIARQPGHAILAGNRADTSGGMPPLAHDHSNWRKSYGN